MPEQDLAFVRSFKDTSSFAVMKAAQVGLVGTDSADEGKYIKLSKVSVTDLKEYSYEEARKKSFYLYQRNALAKRVIEIFADFCSGDDLVVNIKKMRRAEGKDIEVEDDNSGQQVWDDFYEDPVNHLDQDFAGMLIDLFINGELSIPAFVNPSNGSVRLGYIAPQYIKSVVPLPKNQREIDLLAIGKPDGVSEDKLKVIRWNYEVATTDENYNKLAGECFFFRMNKIPSQNRGYPLILQHIDCLDAFDNFLFSTVEGFDARSRYFYDVKMEGLTEEQLKNKTVHVPANGEANIHNEKVTWDVITPDLKSSDYMSAVNGLQDFATGTMGLPKTWFGKGDEVNRATAEALTVPTMRMLARTQKTTKDILKFMALYVLQCAGEKNTRLLKADEYFDVEVSMFTLGGKDIESTGTAFVALVNALAIAEDKGYILADDAKKVVSGMLSKLGVEVEESESVEDVKKKNLDKKDKKVYDKLPEPPQMD
jgi:hypothetical protein